MIGWRKNLLVSVLFALALYAAYWIGGLPESLCEKSSFPSKLSSDRIYQATLLKEVCGYDISYLLKVEKFGNGGWFYTQHLEDDSYPDDPVEPLLTWDADKLTVDIRTERMSGSIADRKGNLTVIRNFMADRPLHRNPFTGKAE